MLSKNHIPEGIIEEKEKYRRGKLYNSDEWSQFAHSIKHEFHDSSEVFEVYKCPECQGHFLVESEAITYASVLWCPYCQFEFRTG